MFNLSVDGISNRCLNDLKESLTVAKEVTLSNVDLFVNQISDLDIDFYVVELFRSIPVCLDLLRLVLNKCVKLNWVLKYLVRRLLINIMNSGLYLRDLEHIDLLSNNIFNNFFCNVVNEVDFSLAQKKS